MPGYISASLRCRVPHANAAWSAGFTLIELLLVIAVISVLAGVGVAVVGNVQESTRVSKLESDVATVNAAIQVYKVSGGALPGNPTVDDVLDQLKKEATAASAAQIAGFRGSVIDPRLMAEMQSGSEASSGQERALWDATEQRFVIAGAGAAGVKRFYLDDTAGEVDYGTEARTTANPLGTTDQWVWDYADTAATAPTGPVLPTTGTATASAAPTAPGVQQLAQPAFDPPEGDHPAFDFDLPVTLSNPNSPGVSQIWVNTGSGDVLYTGQSITVAPGGSITAVAKTIDPDRWSDSNSKTGTWNAVPFQLEVSLSLPSPSMTYAEVGGAMNGVEVASAAPATVQITNLAEIPSEYQSSTYFQVVWTYDGSDPLTSGSAVTSDSFSNGVIPFEIDTSLAMWGTGDSLQIRAAARAVDANVFASSAVQEGTIAIEPTVLTKPYIDPPSTARSADLPVYIYETIGGVYPAGARIYYALGGVDPGSGSDGEPTGGTLYTGPFTTGSTDGAAIVNARFYGPSGFAQWFTPSPVGAVIYTAGSGGTGAVVGDATVNGTYIGSLILTSTKNINFNSGSIIKAGNLYVRGTPTVDLNNGGVIEGRQFLSDGTEVIPATDTRTIVDLDGSASPSNYTIRLNSGSKIEGKIYRRVNIFEPPEVSQPPGPSNNNNLNLNSPPAAPIDPTQFANINLNNGAGDVELLPGNYGDMNAGSGTSFVLGTAGATEPAVYNFQGLNLNSSSQLKIVGPVILTIDRNVNISSAVLGNSAHPEWLELRIYSGNFSINSGAAAYADLVAPNSNVSLNGIFTGSVVAKTLTINGDGVAITQAIVTDE